MVFCLYSPGADILRHSQQLKERPGRCYRAREQGTAATAMDGGLLQETGGRPQGPEALPLGEE